MAPKRNLDTKETNEMKSKPKKTKKAYKSLTSDKIKSMNKLFKACQSGNLEKVRQILEINQQITSKEIKENKLLHTASGKGSVEIVEELLNLQTRNSFTCGNKIWTCQNCGNAFGPWCRCEFSFRCFKIH